MYLSQKGKANIMPTADNERFAVGRRQEVLLQFRRQQ